jgi:hypothetical protein
MVMREWAGEWLRGMGLPYREGYCWKAIKGQMRSLRGGASPYAPMELFRKSAMDELLPFLIGATMNDTAQMLKGINEEVQKSKEVLQELNNQIMDVSNIVQPALAKQITDIRNQRMALIGELSQSLNMLKEVRKFFMESEYDKEMERLERFVKVCQQIKALKEDGTFDAVVDSAIRLAIKEEQKNAG